MKISYLIIALGLVIVVVGLMLHFGVKIGSLPGDIQFEKGNFHFYFPITTAIILSVVFSLVLMLFRLFQP
ncbi:MAG: DUF2905 domain-containing protein [Candidatus Nanoarchaeia archaeon]